MRNPSGNRDEIFFLLYSGSSRKLGEIMSLYWRSLMQNLLQ